MGQLPSRFVVPECLITVVVCTQGTSSSSLASIFYFFSLLYPLTVPQARHACAPKNTREEKNSFAPAGDEILPVYGIVAGSS